MDSGLSVMSSLVQVLVSFWMSKLPHLSVWTFTLSTRSLQQLISLINQPSDSRSSWYGSSDRTGGDINQSEEKLQPDVWFFTLPCRYRCLCPATADFKADCWKQNTSSGPPLTLLGDIVAVQLFLPASQWCAQTEWPWTMGSMQWSAGYNEADVWLLGAHSRQGGRWCSPSLSLSSHSFASLALSLFLLLLQTCEHAHIKTHTSPTSIGFNYPTPNPQHH